MRLHFENNIFVVSRSPRVRPFAFQKETKQKKKTVQRNGKQRRRESNLAILHVQATP